MFSRRSRFLFVLPVVFATLFYVTGCRPRAPQNKNLPTNDARTQQLHTDAGAGRLAFLHWPNFPDYKSQVTTFYAQRDWDPAWVDGRKPTRQAIALIHLFAASGSKGLNPEDYDASLWAARLRFLAHADDRQLADFDVAMTVGTMRYISDLHIGRINPAHFSFGVDVQSKKYDLPSFLAQQVVGAGNMQQALSGVEPDFAQYRATLQALQHYQELARQAGTEQPLPLPATALAAGAHYARAGALAARLSLLGDMPAAQPDASSAVYTGALADGVKAFQSTCDLPANGKLTPKTVAALNVPLAQRVLQIEDTLERMRWLPAPYQNAAIVVNIPEFVLRAYGPDHQEALSMKVVVGESLDDDHKTPILSQQMKYLVFRPFWVVTPTIIKKELVPKVVADKNYLSSHNFEVITRTGKPVPDWTLDGLEHGRYMVREKPGPQNSLGLVKFIFPNKLNIYMHSTPAVQLFARSRRDYSHGCVRLQNPSKLADWVLADQPQWTPDIIQDAMDNGPDSLTVPLTHPIPVLIFYATARVGSDGKVYFFPDLYGYDKRLEDTIAGGDPYPVKPLPKKDNAGDTA